MYKKYGYKNKNCSNMRFIHKLSMLKASFTSYERFIGTIPSSIGSLINLVGIGLYINSLNGKLM